MYSKIVLTNNDPSDPAATVIINQGAATANGPVLATLAATAAEIGVGKKATVSPSVYTALINTSTYVGFTSALKPAGKLRGQIK